MTTTDNPTHNENWIALDKAQQQDATQTDILAQAIDEADAIVVGIGAGMSASDGFTYIGERFTQNFPVCTRLIVGRNIGHLKVVS